MAQIVTPFLTRRRLIIGAGVLMAGSVFAAGRLFSQGAALNAAGQLVTPEQTEGPFYPVDWSGDTDADLVQVNGDAARAQGIVTHVRGRVLGADGKPASGARVEIWQCDANGQYRHPDDDNAGEADGRFQGRGRVTAGANGEYAFRTIKPVAYPGRTPHIHFKVVTPGGEALTTQMYVAGDPLNEQDGVLRSIRDSRQRAAVQVKLEAAGSIEAAALIGQFDIVLA